MPLTNPFGFSITLRSLENAIAYPVLSLVARVAFWAEIVILQAFPSRLVDIDDTEIERLFAVPKVVP